LYARQDQESAYAAYTANEYDPWEEFDEGAQTEITQQEEDETCHATQTSDNAWRRWIEFYAPVRIDVSAYATMVVAITACWFSIPPILSDIVKAMTCRKGTTSIIIDPLQTIV